MPAAGPQQPLELQFTLKGTFTVPPGSQLVADMHGNVCEVRLPNGLLLSLFAQVYAQPAREADGQLLSTAQVEALDCWVDDSVQDLRTRQEAPMLTLDELEGWPHGPALASHLPHA